MRTKTPQRGLTLLSLTSLLLLDLFAAPVHPHAVVEQNAALT